MLERMVAKDRAMRFSSVQEVKAALAMFGQLADHPGSAVVAPRPALVVPLESEVRRVSEQTARPRERSVSALAVSAAILTLVLAGVLVGGTLALWPDEDTPQQLPVPRAGETPTATTSQSGESTAGASTSSSERTAPSDVQDPSPSSQPAREPPSSSEPAPAATLADTPITSETSARATRRVERSSGRTHPTPQVRSMEPTTPTRLAPRPGSQRVGTNDAPILR